jgi:hypothetical protein
MVNARPYARPGKKKFKGCEIKGPGDAGATVAWVIREKDTWNGATFSGRSIRTGKPRFLGATGSLAGSQGMNVPIW